VTIRQELREEIKWLAGKCLEHRWAIKKYSQKSQRDHLRQWHKWGHTLAREDLMATLRTLTGLYRKL